MVTKSRTRLKDRTHTYELRAPFSDSDDRQTRGKQVFLQHNCAERILAGNDLRQAVVLMMNSKDELEEQNASLRSLLDGEMEHSSALRLEVDNLKRKVGELEERHAAKIQALARENEVLKVQLKKYVGAVQMLKREGQNDAIPNVRNIDGEALAEVKPLVGSDELASSYERKLIEVAEMHGELMEFNERLHRTLISKEVLVAQMRQELIDLRGPVPGDLSQTSEDPSLSDFEISHRALINVWIPSVFLRGKSANAFHVYQVRRFTSLIT
ncbi:sorting nexin-29-like [Discoglossus pictus]